MTDYRSVLERAGSNAPSPDLELERVLRRRDRRRRTERIAASVVGIALFLTVVLIVTSVGSIDRTQTLDDPAPAETAPSETAATETGPTDDPYSMGWEGLPPEGVRPSEPLRGELVMRDQGIHPWFAVTVYADGRLIWRKQIGGPDAYGWIEQRLTPEGVGLLRSGAVPLGGQLDRPGEQLPASAWEDPELRSYVPSRYAICPWFDLSRAMELLPARARDLLRGTERTFRDYGDGSRVECFEATIEDARVLAEILSEAGFERGGLWFSKSGAFTDERDDVFEFHALLPDGNTYLFFGG